MQGGGRLLHELLFYPFFSFSLVFQRVQKNFEGKLVGADRAKDLAVLKVSYLMKFHLVFSVINFNYIILVILSA